MFTPDYATNDTKHRRNNDNKTCIDCGVIFPGEEFEKHSSFSSQRSKNEKGMTTNVEFIPHSIVSVTTKAQVEWRRMSRPTDWSPSYVHAQLLSPHYMVAVTRSGVHGLDMMNMKWSRLYCNEYVHAHC